MKRSADISLAATAALVLFALIGAIGGTATFVTVHSLQLGQSGSQVVTSATTSLTSSSGNPGLIVTIEQGSGTNATSVYYSPTQIIIVIGTNNTVTWLNNDSTSHTVTSNTGAFNSGNIDPGASWSFTFTSPGTYNYHCSYHSWMRGTVVVEQM